MTSLCALIVRGSGRSRRSEEAGPLGQDRADDGEGDCRGAAFLEGHLDAHRARCLTHFVQQHARHVRAHDDVEIGRVRLERREEPLAGGRLSHATPYSVLEVVCDSGACAGEI